MDVEYGGTVSYESRVVFQFLFDCFNIFFKGCEYFLFCRGGINHLRVHFLIHLYKISFL